MSYIPLPLFPLSTVLYSQGLLPLRIFEPRYIDLVSSSLRNRAPFGIVPLLQGAEVGPGAVFHTTGVAATIVAWEQGRDGLLHNQVEGGARFLVHTHERHPDGLVLGHVSWTAPDIDEPIPPDLAHLSGLLQRIFEDNRDRVPYKAWHLLSSLWVSQRLAEVLPLAINERIAILEATSGLEKLRRIEAMISRFADSRSPSSAH
jgi:uncharacterized protein